MKRLALLAFACAACSGADVDLLAPADGSAIDSTEPTPDSSAPVDASQSDASADADAGFVDVAPPIDAAPPYQDPGIACGNTHCDQDADLCCGTITSYYPEDTYSFACEALSDLVQCAAGLPIDCDDDRDCPSGESCCATLGYQDYSKVQCQQGPCTNTIYGQEVHFCDPNDSDCAQNTTCKPAPYLTGYFTCQ